MRDRGDAEGLRLSIGLPLHSRRPLAPRLATGWLITSGLGYVGGALVFTAGLAVTRRGLHLVKNVSNACSFWAAFILTRPLGATVGDLLDKPVHEGGLAFSRPIASAVIAVFIVVCVLVLPQRAGRHPGAPHVAASG